LTAQTVAIDAPILFDANDNIVGITHTASSSTITVTAAGVYSVFFSVSATEPNQFALAVDGNPVSVGGIYGSGAGTQQNTGMLIISLPAGANLTIVNHSSAAAVTLATPVGGTETNVNASVVIHRLN
jgi:hypothetical protein